MKKRWSAFILAMVLLLSISNTAFACDEQQTNTYITQILFGDRAQSKSSDENVKMLLAALYLCSEQADNQGQDKIDYLKLHRVSGVPVLSSLNIRGTYLLECSHNTWEHELVGAKKNQASRRTVLRNTVNKVFDFGFFNNLFGSSSGKCDSFAALLYYSHILSDYLADDPSETKALCGEFTIPPYSGSPQYILNGDIPTFTEEEKKITDLTPQLSNLDDLGRSGPAFALLGRESMDFVGPRPANLPDPKGWNQQQYPGMIPGNDLYNRSHLIGRQFCGVDNKYNLLTGTTYLNQVGMKQIEDAVSDYLKEHPQNHVLYRVTPVFKGYNMLASGVQMEAYSVEDNGAGICFNRYCYNVQPGVDINYATGSNELSDTTFGAENILPFAVFNANDTNPDLILEMNKHLAVLFAGQKNTGTYTSMMNQISTIASEARAVGYKGENSAQAYMVLKQYQYKYFEVLKTYVPLLLEKEDFFKSVFK